VLANKHEFIFRYICRENFNSEFNGINCEHNFFGENYYKIISTFDIGISPFLENNLRTKGKIAMKHQEFLLMGIPQVCSPIAISEFVKNREDVYIAYNDNDWEEKLQLLLNDYCLRETLGQNSKKLFQRYYTYESQYANLKQVLLK